MTLQLILEMLMLALLASLIYTFLGLFPGTDETAVLVPSTLILLSLGVSMYGILAFFISAMISLNVTDSIPTALTGIPGGVMSTPFVPYSKYLKKHNQVTKSLYKMTLGSLVGSLTALLVFFVLYGVFNLMPVYHQKLIAFLKTYQNYVFLAGAFILALFSQKRFKILLWMPVITGVMMIVKIYLLPNMTSNTPYFLSITTGPILLSIVTALFIKKPVDQKPVVLLPKKQRESYGLTRSEIKSSLYVSLLSCATCMLSPVGMSALIGESSIATIKNEQDKAVKAVIHMNATKNASYLFGFLASLFIFKIQISPVAIGPGSGFFDTYLAESLALNKAWPAIIIGSLIALIITVILSLRYAHQMTRFVFKYISQEAVVLLLLMLFLWMTLINGGLLAAPIMIIVSLFLGYVNMQGVTYGVLFMLLYATQLWV